MYVIMRSEFVTSWQINSAMVESDKSQHNLRNSKYKESILISQDNWQSYTKKKKTDNWQRTAGRPKEIKEFAHAYF